MKPRQQLDQRGLDLAAYCVWSLVTKHQHGIEGLGFGEYAQRSLLVLIQNVLVQSSTACNENTLKRVFRMNR